MCICFLFSFYLALSSSRGFGEIQDFFFFAVILQVFLKITAVNTFSINNFHFISFQSSERMHVCNHISKSVFILEPWLTVGENHFIFKSGAFWKIGNRCKRSVFHTLSLRLVSRLYDTSLDGSFAESPEKAGQAHRYTASVSDSFGGITRPVERKGKVAGAQKKKEKSWSRVQVLSWKCLCGLQRTRQNTVT